MQFFQGFHALKTDLTGSVVTIGNFDGVHRGHRQLITQLVTLSHQLAVPSVVVTFQPHPVQVLSPEKPFFRIFDQKDQLEQMAEMGVDYLIEQKFDQDFSRLSAEDFLRDSIGRYLKPRHLVVGHDFVFGAGRSGNHEFLKKYCSAHHWQLSIVPADLADGLPISSSRIRQALAQGNLESANHMLGRAFMIHGKVVHGHRRGHQIGVPTANIHPHLNFIPRKGVYFSKTLVDGKRYNSITNIGQNPTFEAEQAPVRVESHLFDFDQDLYGKQIQIELLHFTRDENKFKNVDELKKQIFADLQAARGFFASN